MSELDFGSSAEKGLKTFLNPPKERVLKRAQRRAQRRGHFRDRQKHDSQRRDRILRFSSPGNRAIFSTFWGDFLTKLDRKPGKHEKIHWRKFKKSSGDGAPKLQIFVVEPCPDMFDSFQTFLRIKSKFHPHPHVWQFLRGIFFTELNFIHPHPHPHPLESTLQAGGGV